MVIHDPPIQGSFLRAMKRLGNGWKTKKGQELFSDFGWCEFPSEWKRSGETKTAKTLPSGNGGFFPCDFCDSDFWGGFFKRRGKPTGQCLYRETDFSCPNIAENPRVGKFPLKTSLEHNQKLFIYRWLFPMAVWKKSSPWNTDVASYVSLLHWLLTNPYPKKCLVENFLYKHWNQKKSPPQNKKIIQNFHVVSIPMPLSLVFFSSPKFWGQNSWRETETPKGEVWRPKLDLLGVFGATWGARTPASGMWRSSWHRTNPELQSGPVGPMDISSNQPFPTVDGWNLAPPGMYKTL